jgi:hypothetical protein
MIDTIIHSRVNYLALARARCAFTPAAEGKTRYYAAFDIRIELILFAAPLTSYNRDTRKGGDTRRRDGGRNKRG